MGDKNYFGINNNESCRSLWDSEVAVHIGHVGALNVYKGKNGIHDRNFHEEASGERRAAYTQSK